MSYVRTRLGRWFYEERGAPARSGDPALVLMHSFLYDGGMWRAQVPALARMGRVLNVDGPGHGKSEVPPPFTLEEHADALVDALDSWRVDRAILCGLSWGGMVAMRIAIRHPARVAGLALLDTSARREPLQRRLRYRGLIPLARLLGLPRPFVALEVAPKMYGPTTLAARPELVAELARQINGFPREGVARAAMAVMMERADVRAALGAVRTPTLVLCGREDRATRPRESEILARCIPGARLAWIERCGHVSALEQPEEVTREIGAFCGRVLGATGAAGEA